MALGGLGYNAPRFPSNGEAIAEGALLFGPTDCNESGANRVRATFFVQGWSVTFLPQQFVECALAFVLRRVDHAPAATAVLDVEAGNIAGRLELRCTLAPNFLPSLLEIVNLLCRSISTVMARGDSAVARGESAEAWGCNTPATYSERP